MIALLRSAAMIGALGAVLYVLCCAALFAMQRSLLYFPPRRMTDPAGATVTLPVEGAQLRISTRTMSGSDAVVYFGGNAEDVAQSMPTLERAFPERALFAMHYRGYAGSTGNPTETALVADALMLFDRVHAQHPHIVVIGRSLGSGVAIHVASLREVERLVLVTPYDSLQDLAARRFSWFPVRWLLIDKYESWRYAPHVTAPTRLLAAQYDEVIPRESTERLYRRLPGGLATLNVIPDAGHNTISETTEYPRLLGAAL